MAGITQPTPVSAPAVAPQVVVVSGPLRNAARLAAMTSASTKAMPKMRASPPFMSSLVRPLVPAHARWNRSGEYHSPPRRKVESAAAVTATQLMSMCLAPTGLLRVSGGVLYDATPCAVLGPARTGSDFGGFVEELVDEFADAVRDLDAFEVAVLLAERVEWYHGLRHRPVAAGAADVVEAAAHELAGVLRVTEVTDRDAQVAVELARDDRPLHAFELQEDAGGVGDEISPDDGPEVGAEDLIGNRALGRGLDHVIEAVHRDLGPLQLADHRRVGQRI